MASSQIIILAIVATSAATYISRFMGVITSERVSTKSKIFKLSYLNYFSDLSPEKNSVDAQSGP